EEVMGRSCGVAIAEIDGFRRSPENAGSVAPVPVPVPDHRHVPWPAVGEGHVGCAPTVRVPQMPHPVADHTGRVDAISVPITDDGDVTLPTIGKDDVGSSVRPLEMPASVHEDSRRDLPVTFPVAHDRNALGGQRLGVLETRSVMESGVVVGENPGAATGVPDPRRRAGDHSTHDRPDARDILVALAVPETGAPGLAMIAVSVAALACIHMGILAIARADPVR